jgi:hypothetical protein
MLYAAMLFGTGFLVIFKLLLLYIIAHNMSNNVQ